MRYLSAPKRSASATPTSSFLTVTTSFRFHILSFPATSGPAKSWPSSEPARLGSSAHSPPPPATLPLSSSRRSKVAATRRSSLERDSLWIQRRLTLPTPFQRRRSDEDLTLSSKRPALPEPW